MGDGVKRTDAEAILKEECYVQASSIHHSTKIGARTVKTRHCHCVLQDDAGDGILVGSGKEERKKNGCGCRMRTRKLIENFSR